jgi:hypothetical protein
MGVCAGDELHGISKVPACASESHRGLACRFSTISPGSSWSVSCPRLSVSFVWSAVGCRHKPARAGHGHLNPLVGHRIGHLFFACCCSSIKKGTPSPAYCSGLHAVPVGRRHPYVVEVWPGSPISFRGQICNCPCLPSPRSIFNGMPSSPLWFAASSAS